MAKVISIHEVNLKPGVSPEEFERYLAGMPDIEIPGMKAYFARGDRGERAGKYAFVIEVDSVERRDELFPVQDDALAGEAAKQAIQAYMDFFERGSALQMSGDDVYTDYAAVTGAR